MGLEELKALFAQAPCGTPLIKSGDCYLWKTKNNAAWWAGDWKKVKENLKYDNLTGWVPNDHILRGLSRLILKGDCTLVFEPKVDEDLLWE